MTEPASSTVAGVAGWKLIGGVAGIAGIGAAAAAIVVMCATPPRSPREWAIGLVSTVMGSVTGGAALVEYLGIQNWASTPTGLMGLVGVCFAAGLPAWAAVRALFTWIEKRRDKDLAELAAEIKKSIKG